MSDQVGNPKDRFSQNEAQMIPKKIKKQKKKKNVASEVTGRKSTLNSTCSFNMIDYRREKLKKKKKEDILRCPRF